MSAFLVSDDHLNVVEQIKDSETYKQVMADSFGGVMYNVANRNKYDAEEIITLWDSLSPAERENAGGIMRGAFHFLKGSN